MIPKIIHYCWMSNDAWDDKTVKCFNSWKKYLKNWEYKLWNFETLPNEVLETPAVKNAIKNKKWAFVADYVRIWALYNFGGLYMDLDVELLKNPEPLFSREIILGMEKNEIGCHFMASIPGTLLFKQILDKIRNKTNFQPLPGFVTPIFSNIYNENPESGEFINGIIYPNDYFNPFFWDTEKNEGKLNITSSTVCIHWYAGGWIPKYKKNKVYKSIYALLYRLKIVEILKKIRGY